MRTRSIAAAALVLFAILNAPLYAQQQSATLQWDYDVAPSEVQTYTQTITIDGNPITTPPTCAAGAASGTTTCSLVMPALATGSHSINIMAAKNNMSSEVRIVGLDPATGPHSARNPRYSINITINIQ